MLLEALPLSFAAVPIDFATADPKLSASRPIDRKLVPMSSRLSSASSASFRMSRSPSAPALDPASIPAPMPRPASSTPRALSTACSRRVTTSSNCSMASFRPKSRPKVISLLSGISSPPHAQKEGEASTGPAPLFGPFCVIEYPGLDSFPVVSHIHFAEFLIGQAIATINHHPECFIADGPPVAPPVNTHSRRNFSMAEISFSGVLTSS